MKPIEREEIPENMTFGILDEQSQLLPSTESEMIQASLQVLEHHQYDAIPHVEIERWVNSMTTVNWSRPALVDLDRQHQFLAAIDP